MLPSFDANYVYYSADENLYHAEGNVIVRSNENGDQLRTEELFWDPEAKEFYTDKFVTIHTDDEVHTGEGMRADQDFTYYSILSRKEPLLLKMIRIGLLNNPFH